MRRHDLGRCNLGRNMSLSLSNPVRSNEREKNKPTRKTMNEKISAIAVGIEPTLAPVLMYDSP